MATAMPSGMLWMEMAKVMLAPICGSLSAPMKVAIPSGKLWMAIANAERIPNLWRAFSLLLWFYWLQSSSDNSETSCGFSYSGTRKSMSMMIPMPPKKARSVNASPYLTEPMATISACASGRSSASDINIITPALSPSDAASVLLLNFFLNSTSAPPMPVAAPAISVRSNAVSIPFITLFLCAQC